MLANGVKETTATTGTGTVTLAAVTGSVRFSQSFSVGALVSYAIKDGDNWEWGIGTVGAGNTLARTTITATLVAGTYTASSATAITLASGAAEVICAIQGGPWVGDQGGAVRDGDYFATGDWLVSVLNNTQVMWGFSATACLLTRPMLITHAAVNVTAATASTTLTLAIYADDGTSYPGARLWQSTGVDATTTGFKEVATGGILLKPGLYWLGTGVVGSGNPTCRAQNQGISIFGPGGAASSALAANTSSGSGWYKAAGSATDPAPTAMARNSQSPSLFIRGTKL